MVQSNINSAEWIGNLRTEGNEIQDIINYNNSYKGRFIFSLSEKMTARFLETAKEGFYHPVKRDYRSLYDKTEEKNVDYPISPIPKPKIIPVKFISTRKEKIEVVTTYAWPATSERGSEKTGKFFLNGRIVDRKRLEELEIEAEVYRLFGEDTITLGELNKRAEQNLKIGYNTLKAHLESLLERGFVAPFSPGREKEMEYRTMSERINL